MRLTAERIAGRGATAPGLRDQMIRRLRSQGIREERVLEQMAGVPRHVFLDEALSHRAYEDCSLPIGHRQTLSQPFIVALMTELLIEGKELNNVLELGTGSGYQAAVLSRLVKRVYTQERILPLLKQADERFYALRYRNVYAKHSGGDEAWSSKAPFDGIMLTAAGEEIPERLLGQLAEGGRLVMPLCREGEGQVLVRITCSGGQYHREDIQGVHFVPLLNGEVGGRNSRLSAVG